MENRLFGFDASEMNLGLPDSQTLETEMKAMFGRQSFETSVLFSLTNDN